MGAERTFNAEEYSGLIGLIYDAARNPMLWPELLETMGTVLDLNPEHSAPNPGAALLEPHFDRAIAINSHITRLEARSSTADAVLNRLPVGIIIAESDGGIIACNARAERVLQAGHILRRDSAGHLCATDPSQRRKLQHLIGQHAGPQPPSQGTALHLERESHSASLWIAASDDALMRRADHSHGVIIYIASSLIPPEYSIASIRDHFGLTDAEARLVRTLANGCNSLNEAAANLGVSIHTVRTQIKKVFDKTGTNCQVELVKKVLTSPAAIFGVAQPPRPIMSTSGDSPAPLYCRHIRLCDGRRLAWEEYGDPQGRPVFLFHAFLGSRLQYPATESSAEQLGLRIIVPDRPGYGLSDPAPNRTLCDWPDDIAQLADHLELPRFSLLSYSSGCAYALACAHHLPQRIDKTVLVSGRGPEAYEGLSIDRLLLGMARGSPKLFRHFMRVSSSALLRDVTGTLARREKRLCKHDRRFLSGEPENRAMYATAVREALRQGSDGASQDMLIMLGDWGFSPAEISIPIRLWHGTEDQQFPLADARRLAASLPNCRTSYIPNNGSMLILRHWHEILTDLATA